MASRRAELLDRRVDDLCDVFSDAASAVTQARGHRPSRWRGGVFYILCAVDRDDGGPFGGEQKCTGATDPAPPAGDDGDLPCMSAHGFSPILRTEACACGPRRSSSRNGRAATDAAGNGLELVRRHRPRCAGR